MMLCIGVGRLFRDLLQDALSCFEISETLPEPYALHVPVLEVLVAMEDISIWSMRNIVRGIEKVRRVRAERATSFPIH